MKFKERMKAITYCFQNRKDTRCVREKLLESIFMNKTLGLKPARRATLG